MAHGRIVEDNAKGKIALKDVDAGTAHANAK
jgi:hypothetical protein